MRNLFLIGTLLIISANSLANTAKIFGKDENDKDFIISLDRNDIPRKNENMKTYPTIKDFRDGSDFYNVCYLGPSEDIKELLKALVDAANGDGDSWAELKSLTQNKKKEFNVSVLITDESGENEEKYSFKPCE